MTETNQQIFKNIRDVVKSLQTEGWKVSQSTVYKHRGEGKIKAEADGSFTLRNVTTYARNFLMLKDSKQKVADEELNRQKIKAEILRLEEQAKLAQVKRAIEEGKYIERSSFELELAARAGVLDNMRKANIQARASERVALVGGDTDKVRDLITFDLELHDEEMNAFATLKQFHVIFEGREDDVEETDGEEEQED